MASATPGSGVPTAVPVRRYPAVSVRGQIVAAALRATVKPLLSLWARWPELPWPYNLVDHAGRLLTVAPGQVREPVELNQCTAEWVRPVEVSGNRAVLYMHGGGFYVGHQHLHRQMVSRICRDVAMPVLTVNYRMLPQNAIEDSVTDCVDAFRHLLQSGIRPDQVVFMGDSAGGYLVFMAAICALEAGLPAPGAIVALSPLTNWDHEPKLSARTADACALFPRSAIRALTAQATGARPGPVIPSNRRPPRSPVDENLSGLPPVLIQASTTEMLSPDARLMAGRLKQYRVPCTLQYWDKQVHVFQAAAGFVPEARQAIDLVAEFIHEYVVAHSRDEAAG
ncbi:alpha/beta hydrolase [Hoyosella subflava]|uniref:Putative esterase n=1 Tax=Hoyosella subflava (strain DSM 45089 / JCM 17490 / NBRC 109087 / DQS3-9A1) TaxID=443218 RepID=F6EQU2_HOYSD|nr:alpha/beta hydrolase fold domain-containing protein [Hoyosella subflava]AEF39553.1 putative esterase [Hoyosella subflava DQS3-9A1]